MRAVVLSCWLLVACGAAVPRPQVLGTLDSASQSPAVLEAKAGAPQAYAHAEDLRRRAEAALSEKDSASAQILGEQALAAFEHAVVLSRLTQAEVRRGDAEARLAHSETELKALDAQEQRVRAELEDLELRARVISDALPLPASAPGAPEREQARFEAARALGLQARLLCAAARLLEPTRPSLSPLLGELDGLDSRLAKKTPPTPIDDSIRLRARCLAELSQVRRPKTLQEPARGTEDALLAELSNAAYSPSRDDRGVVVTLRGLFGKDSTLSAPAVSTLQALGRVAGSHPAFPVLVVLHRSGAQNADRDKPRLDSLSNALKQAGAARVDSASGGDAVPVVDPARPGASERNERVEVVFVAPSSG
ncbi:MAG TPA: hypothetical protein VG937_36040 [Polyangiaceae bacterium]|nr:hypothetical protein [Polyangiaceae bacterium]